jgi:hypothetical protein
MIVHERTEPVPGLFFSPGDEDSSQGLLINHMLRSSFLFKYWGQFPGGLVSYEGDKDLS